LLTENLARFKLTHYRRSKLLYGCARVRRMNHGTPSAQDEPVIVMPGRESLPNMQVAALSTSR